MYIPSNTIKEYLELTIIERRLSSASAFRDRRAGEYSEDPKNAKCAAALSRLADAMSNVSPEHPLVRECYHLEVELRRRLSEITDIFAELHGETSDSERIASLWTKATMELDAEISRLDDDDPVRFLEFYKECLKECFWWTFKNIEFGHFHFCLGDVVLGEVVEGDPFSRYPPVPDTVLSRLEKFALYVKRVGRVPPVEVMDLWC